MKTHIRAFWLLAALFIAVSGASAQDPTIFTSGDGGFAIDIPRSGVVVSDKELNDKGLEGSGKIFEWTKQGQYFYQIGYYLMENTPLTPAQRAYLSDGFKVGIIEAAKKDGFASAEKPYLFQGNKGVEVKVIFPYGISLSRTFTTKTRFYFISISLNSSLPESGAIKILDSFRLLDAATLKAVKIEEATPAPIPQEPPAKKLKSDLEDNNLKGKVREIIEDTVRLPGTRRTRSGEKYYDPRGNLMKVLIFDDGYPELIEIWGSIDGNRVSNSDVIWFHDDQRPPRKEIIQSMMESPMTPPSEAGPTSSAPPKSDPRYSTRYAYKYDNLGRLIETSMYDNSGEHTDRTTFTYSAGRREERSFWGDGEEYHHKTYLLDTAGNVTEESNYNDEGVVDSRSVYKYEFDPAGNWIVQRASEKKTVRGKTVLKPASITYRTITYYP